MNGIIFALLAATCNSSIGIFSNILLNLNMSSGEIAFWRCFFAFILTGAICFYKYNLKDIFTITKQDFLKYMILSFCGINIMYFCETMAVSYIAVSLVSFLLYASGILTIILSWLFLHEKMSVAKILALSAVFLGVIIIFMSNLSFAGNLLGVLLAICAGTGYSLYIFLNKKWQIISGMKTLFYLFFFGTVFLGVQLLFHYTSLNISAAAVPYLFLLVLIPTVGGFYCTNKAISLSPASVVQLVEMSEPFIATILGFLVLNQMISLNEFFGGLFISLGLLLIIKGDV